ERALQPRVLRADALVVRVEEDRVALVDGAVGGGKATQDEGLVKPARVRQVPLGRAGVAGGLEREVVRLEGRAQPLGGGADGAVDIGERSAVVHSGKIPAGERLATR